MTQYKPDDYTTESIIPTNNTNKDMQQFYTTTLAIVALISLAMIIIYAMRRSV